jgi:septum formation protein
MLKVVDGKELVLASASPRRRELLAGCGLMLRVQAADLDETPLPNETAGAMVARLAAEKARAVSALIPDAWILAADTTVVCAGQVLGKPVDQDDALRMLALLQGTTHQVLSAFALVCRARQSSIVETHSSRVTMVPIAHSLMRAYVATGEPLDKAGAYAVQGIGAQWIEKVEGSYTNVVGLNLARVVQLLLAQGIVEPVCYA